MSTKDIYYLNSANTKQVLSEWPVAVTDITQLYGKEWQISVKENKARNRSRVQYIYRTTREFPLSISIYADSESEFDDLMNTLENTTEYDITHSNAGRLYVGDWYLECFVRQTAPTTYEPLFDTVDTQWSVYSAYPHWIRETSKSYYQSGSEPLDNGEPDVEQEWLNFNYNFKYNYGRYGGLSMVTNGTVSEADFQLTIYGPVSNPAVYIGGHLYQVNVDLASGERLVIDTRTPSVIWYHADGTEESAYAYRDTDSYIFELIPAGNNTVTWNGTFSFDLTVYERRSEPEW